MSLSIIIPVHNTEHYLAECLGSVLSDVNIDDEIILVENGSSDHSWEKCQKYAEQYETVKAVQMDTVGVSRARNYGISLAKGDWITFLDSDDCIDPSIIRMAHKLNNHSDKDVVLFSYCYLHKAHSNESSVSEKLHHVDSDLLRRSVLEFCKYEKQIRESTPLDHMSIWSCWGKLYRKSLIVDKKIRFPEKLFLSEDTAFVFQVYCNTDKIYTTPMIAYYYREAPDSVTRNVSFKTIKNNRYLRKWMTDYILKQGLDNSLEKEASAFMVRKFIEECLYLRSFKEKSRTARLRYMKTNAEEPDMKKALQEVDSKSLISGKRNTLLYSTVLWLLRRDSYRILFIK